MEVQLGKHYFKRKFKFNCLNCKKVYDILVSIREDKPKECPGCGSKEATYTEIRVTVEGKEITQESRK